MKKNDKKAIYKSHENSNSANKEYVDSFQTVLINLMSHKMNHIYPV